MQLVALSKRSNTLDKFVTNLTVFEYLFENHTPVVQMLLDNCQTRTRYAEAVKELDWICNKRQFICFGYSLSREQVAFRRSTQVITQEQANLQITDGEPGSGQGTGRKNKLIVLKMFNIEWIFKKSDGSSTNIGDLMQILSRAPE